MAKTIPESFLKLKENLEITDPQEAIISTRQRNIRTVIETGINLVDPYSFLTGSYSRQTLIAPLKETDIDIFFVLHSKYYYHYENGQNGGQGGLLDWVKKVIKSLWLSLKF